MQTNTYILMERNCQKKTKINMTLVIHTTNIVLDQIMMEGVKLMQSNGDKFK